MEMDSGSISDQDRTFKANFSDEGVAKLKATINDKLKEFMGDYTDDTLVEYVIVLLRNGRRKDDTAKELHVFLGDDNIPFISWLWNHLSANLHLYLEQPESDTNLQKSPQDEKEDQSAKRLKRDVQIKADSEIGTEKTGRKRQKIVWEERERGEEREREKQRFPLRSVVSSVLSPVHEDESNNNKSRTVKTRYQQNSTQQIKRAPQLEAPPRRLLQFAVRDAVKPVPVTPRSEPVPVLKRLRSVLASESVQEEEQEQEEEISYSMPQRRTKSVVTVPAGRRMEASSSFDRAEKLEASSSVFDRLGRARGEMGISREDVEMDSISDNEGYNDDMIDYSVKQDNNGFEKKQIPASQVANKPSKILNISVNVNTWKPASTSVETTQSHQFSVQNTPKSDQTKVSVPANIQRETPKAVSTPVVSSYKAAQTLEDPETRTLFVGNVHFGATKDALSRHFNKFGAVLKVIILTDPSTGQPIGSAYVEFLLKESAEAALSLNGTSFMSRILKVVSRNSSDASQVPGWPRASSFPSRPVRRPTLTPGPITARGPLRGGMTRSLQWKRGVSTNQAVPPAQSPGTVPARSFTYTRVPQKTD